MVSNFAKFARTNKSLIVFSNAFGHVEIFKKFYKQRVKPNEFGYIKINANKVCLLEENLQCDLIQGKTNDLLRNELLDAFTESRYIITSSKFIIFPKKFGFKRVANRIFTDFVIQGAGTVIFEQGDNEIIVKCSGGSKALNIKSRAIDSLIIKDEIEANFND